jgi:hypothetical protein
MLGQCLAKYFHSKTFQTAFCRFARMNVPITAASAAVVVSAPLTFPTGVPALQTTASTTLALTG